MTTLSKKKETITEKQLAVLFAKFYTVSKDLDNFIWMNENDLGEEILKKAKKLSLKFEKISEKYSEVKDLIKREDSDNLSHYEALNIFERKVKSLVTTGFHTIKYHNIAGLTYQCVLGEVEEVERKISSTISKWERLSDYSILEV